MCCHTTWQGLEAMMTSGNNDSSSSSNATTNPDYNDEVAVFDSEAIKIKLKSDRLLYVACKVAKQAEFFSRDSWRTMKEGPEKLFELQGDSFEDATIIETFKLLRIPNVSSMMTCLEKKYDDNAISDIFDFSKYIGSDYLSAACVSIIKKDLVGELISTIGSNPISKIMSLLKTLELDCSIPPRVAVNVCISNGLSPLYAAVTWEALGAELEISDLALCKLFLDSGANPNARIDDGNTSLHDAASKGHKELASLLLEYDTDINSYNNNGEAPIHKAAMKCDSDMCEFLLKKGAEINFGHEPLNKPLNNFQKSTRGYTLNRLMQAQEKL